MAFVSFLLFILSITLIYIIAGLRIVREYQRLVVFRLGKLTGTMGGHF